MTPVRHINAISILGSVINMVDIQFIMKWMKERIKGFDENCMCAGQLLVAGFHGLNQARKYPDYSRIGKECDLWVPDSIAPVLIARYRGLKNIMRTPGADIMTFFFQMADKNGFKSFFYGDTSHTLTALQKKVERLYPGHKVAGTFSPPFRPLCTSEEQAHIEMINASKPDVLWVGLGLPKQDEWIYKHKCRLKVPVAAGVGAAFGFLAETVERAPDTFQRLWLEWAYMLLKKPKRTARRVFFEGSEFFWHVCKEELQKKNCKGI